MFINTPFLNRRWKPAAFRIQLTKIMYVFFILSILTSTVGMKPAAAEGPCDSPANEIIAENCKTGNPSSEWDISGAGDSTIQGFATDISVNRGGTINFKVDTVANSFQIKIYRLGYYNGLGARLIDTIPDTATTATVQPACTNSGSPDFLVDCGGWSISASWTAIDPTYDPDINAVSGLYVARLERTDGTSGASHITFIVRDDDGNSDLLFQTSDTTWQAYNGYGGYSLYAAPNHAHKVSYNRPFSTRSNAPEDFFMNAEYPMLRWLERNGYDVSYFTDVDSDRYGSEILEHKVFLSVGHDEYWSAGQRTAVEAARDRTSNPVHLAFFSGNEIYWKTRWEPSTADGGSTAYRTLVSYKEGDAQIGEHYDCEYNFDCDPHPTEWTGLWRQNQTGHDGGQPENSLSGQISWGDATSAIQVPASATGLRFWRDTGMTGATTLTYGTLGYEFDWEQAAYANSYPLSRITLSDTTVGGKNHMMSLYRAPSGALVFGAGTVQWSWGLDGNHDRGSSTQDPKMQQATVNLFADMGVQPGSLQIGLVAATASTDTTAPTVTITSPANGATVPGGTVTITGTASDTGGLVAAVKVSTDGGTTWNTATGTSNWTYSFNAVSQSITVQAQAIDDSANPGTAANITLTIETQTCPCSIFTPATTGTQESDPSAVELGVKFRSDIAGYITGIRFYKTASNTGTHTGRLWTTGGVNLGTVTFSGESATGWQEMLFTSPVAIDANTTYVASYHTTSGYYAIGTSFASAGVDNPPLHALQEGVDGSNGVYQYGNGGVYPTTSFGSSNYLVDVVFVTSVGPDNTPPVVNSVIPADAASNVSTSANISATFNEPLDPSTVSEATFTLRDSTNALVSAAVTYNATTRTATLDPTDALAYSSPYSVELISGTSGIKDVAGNALASDYTWSFTTASEPPPPPDEGPGGPILVISSAANPFSRYYAEILRTEGLNAFTATDISLVNSTILNAYDVVILGEMSLTSAQVTLLSDWVNAGGNLIAMRPDSQLATLLGLTSAGSTLSEAYLLVNTASAPGQGIVSQTIQFHGTADLYTLNGATAIATLYSNATTATTNPAVTLRSVGSSGGQAAAFTYDLAKSIVYTRQGNPAWKGINGDGSSGPVRADDMFHNGTDPDWVNLDKVAIPQADEQQRLLANMIGFMNLDKTPLPRFWYFPRGERAVVIMTVDDHASGNVAGRLEQYKAASPVGCSVNDWECVRSSIYIYSGSALTAAQANAYTADGFEIGVHVDTGCDNYTLPQLENFYTTQLAAFAARFPALPVQDSERTHCIAWSDWAYQADVKEQNGIRLDANYYFWPPTWVANRPGMFTGSGMPMRFADLDGTMFDVYQATTQMTDESGQTYPYTIDTLLDRALGSEGYYGVFTANMHSDSLISSGSDAIVSSAQARGVPVVSGRQMLDWLDGRNASSFANIAWSGNALSFDVNANSGANGLEALVPTQNGTLSLQSLTRGGSNVTFTVETIKGVSYARFAAYTGSYVAQYASDTTAPIISAVLATPNPDSTVTITWTTDESSDSLVDYGTVSGTLNLNSSNASLVTSHSVTLTGLTAGTYYFTVTSKDAANNSATSTEASFVLTGETCPCTIFENTPGGSQTADNGAYEFGLKFRSSIDGFITGVRFYKPAGSTGAHIGKLWNSAGTLLASATFIETASGWQEVSFSNPVAITANTTYIASYSWPGGYYPYQADAFLTAGVTNGPLTALQSGVDGPNGVYNTTPGSFPQTGGANYFADVIFNYTAPGDTTPPVISAVSATPGTGGTTATIDWTTNEPATSRVDYGTTPDALTLNLSALALVTAHSLALSGLLPNTTYYYRVTSVDASTNSATSPASPATATFTTPSASFADTTVADFSAGSTAACVVDAIIGDGALRLPSTIDEDFSGTALPTGWATHIWTGSSPTVSGGLLTVNGSEAYTSAQYGPGHTLEFVAIFGSQPYQHVGFGGTNPPFNDAPWIMFSTGNDALNLYARVLPAGSTAYNTGNDKILIGDYLGTPHTYRIDWKAESIDFYVDNNLITTVTATITDTMNVAVSDFQSGTPGLTVDWLRLTPYASPCTFTSRVIDAGQLVEWLDLSWVGTAPTGTTVGFETRTSVDNATWSAWQPVTSPLANPNGQYIQYRASLGTTDTAQTPVIESVTLAYAAVPEYTVTFDSQGGTPTPASQSVAFGGLIAEPAAPTKIGHTFSGWFDAATGGTEWDFNIDPMPATNLTLYAQWTANNYTITFDSAGGTAVASITLPYGSAVTAPADPTRAGYTFAGWIPAVPATMPLDGANLTAQWTANDYTVSFDANGGSTPVPTSKQVTYDSAYGTLATTSRTGYTFDGWFTAASGGTQVTAATIVSTASNHTLYAQWTAQPTYTVTYNGNGNTGGTAPTDSNIYLSGATVTVLGNTSALVKIGYTFAGWNTAANGSGTNYNAGETFIMGSANVTLYAQWTAQLIVYLPLVKK